MEKYGLITMHMFYRELQIFQIQNFRICHISIGYAPLFSRRWKSKVKCKYYDGNRYYYSCRYFRAKKIGNFFQNLDNLLSLQKEKLEKLRLLKAALLDKLFV